jgi:hypothetical protein
VLKMRSCLTDVTGAAKAHHPDSLRNGALHPSAACVERFELFRLRTSACALEGVILLFPTHGDGSTWGACGTRAKRTAGAVSTVLGGKFDLDDLRLTVVDSWRPTDTLLAFGTRSLLGLPVKLKLSCCEALLLLGLPLDIGTSGTDEINTVILPAAREQLGIRIAGIYHMLLRQEIFLLQSFMYGRTGVPQRGRTARGEKQGETGKSRCVNDGLPTGGRQAVRELPGPLWPHVSLACTPCKHLRLTLSGYRMRSSYRPNAATSLIS